MFSNTRGLFNGGDGATRHPPAKFRHPDGWLCVGIVRGYFGWNYGKPFRRPSIVDLHFGDYTGVMGIECLKSLLLSIQFEMLSILWKEG